jgi:probable addiction module antidote protein
MPLTTPHTKASVARVRTNPLIRKSNTVKSRPHADSMAQMLHDDPEFASAYLASALEDSHTPEGREALLLAMRYIAQAQGMTQVAQRAGIARESLYRVLSPKGNPTLSTLLAVLEAAGLRFSVAKALA